jgi:hypothetical protein
VHLEPRMRCATYAILCAAPKEGVAAERILDAI